MQPLHTLIEDPGSARGPLPDRLRSLYDGDLALDELAVYANFVASLDGVVSLQSRAGGPSSISGHSEADRLVMALLRARADAVVIGAGTLRAHSGHLWTAAYICPPGVPDLAAVGAEPVLVVVSASGAIDPGEPALQERALVLTSEGGRAALRGRLHAAVKLLSLGERTISAASILAAVRAEGYGPVLTEGGPSLMATFAQERLLDELFLTLSPVLAGRDGDEVRPGLLEGVRLLPEQGLWGRLKSLRQHQSHLFLRYQLDRAAPVPG
ncbi:MAG: dihydrofolate reductase family protein [Candidatus Dormibacteraceae bacterium]